ncbi:MAG: sulfatase [Lentisphaeria bacterium]|nr:sulfatase [Lentisphaeria bacterium]
MSKKNIIWIFSDQQPGYMLSCNGDPNVKTPNIDRMALDGTNFINAVSGFPLCCAYRGSLLSGEYPHKAVPGHEFPLPQHLPTAADYFNEAGYESAYFGKWHLDGHKEANGRAALHEIPKERRGNFDTWLGYENNNSQWDCYVHGHMKDKEIPIYRLPGYETDELTNLFLNYLDEDKTDPFFAVLSVQPPHNPYIAPAEYQGRFNPEDIKLRPNVAQAKSVLETVRHDLAGAYAMVENLDHNVGLILNKLYEKNLDQDTWVLFFSDHGDMHGSHGLFKKTNPYHESSNVPFIAWTGDYRYTNNKINSHTNQVINHVDILPTSLGLAGINVKENLKGHSYAAVINKENAPEDPQSAYLQNVIPTGHSDSFDRPYRGVVTKDGWKYACIDGQDLLMFNLNDDPYEMMNLVYNSKWQEKRQELREMTCDWIKKTNDKFNVPLGQFHE